MRRKRSIAGCLIAVALVAPVKSMAQDVKRGEHVFRKCALCHVLDPKATDLIAPPLHNIIGRRAAEIPGFDYSDIMKVAGRQGLFWTPEALFYFLDRPEEFMPGTYMAFSGLDDQERRDLIAYLERRTFEWKRTDQKQARPAAPTASPPARPPAPQQRIITAPRPLTPQSTN